MDKPTYKDNPIKSIHELAKILTIEPSTLLEISHSARNYYQPNKPQIKPDGSKRQTYRVLQPLQDIQEKIKDNIFYKVEYPIYLQGGIKDARNPRDYVRNASLHAKNSIVIKEDIANFFPSIKTKHVFRIWKDFFGFSEDVSKILTELTTYKGFVPQGAKTSSYIANLVFWNVEPKLENIMQNRGLIYSRLTDDITVSANRNLTQSEIHEITRAVYQMLFSLGFRPKRRKRKVMTSGFRINIHNLNTNSGTPTLSQSERRKIRSAVKQCEIFAKTGLNRDAYEKIYKSTYGRVALLKRLHPKQAQKYIDKLESIEPDKIYQE